MTTKIIRGDGVTELAGVKSCTFTEKVNAEVNLRPGCVSSASIEVEVFGPQSGAVAVGEELTYYQVDAEGNETLIGVFYARPSVPSKTTYKFTAYDAVASLDVDFSERLYSIAADFPMTVYDLVSEACSVAGVTLGSTSWPLSTITVNEFYSPAVTCREILSWAAEIACCFVKCDTAGELVFDWYEADSTHKIYPSSGASGGVTFVPYRENGLDYENYDVAAIQYVAVRPIDTEGVAYVYPSNYQDITATDPLSDGNVTLADLVAVDDGDGNITISTNINITDDGNGNLVIRNSGEGTGGNTLVIADNLLLCDATQATMTSVAKNVYNRMTALGTYRPASVELFNFDNPFRAGDIVAVEDIQGVTFNTLVMEMTTSNSGAEISSTGEREQSDAPQTTAGRLARLGENVVRIKNLVVDTLTAITARIDNLFAQNILCTNSFEVNNGVYYLTQNTDGFTMGSLSESSGGFRTPSTSISANTSDGVLIDAANTDIRLVVHGPSRIVLSSDNLGGTVVGGGLSADRISIGEHYVLPLLSKTVSGTTNSNGNISLSLDPNKYSVLSVRRSDATSIAIPYATGTSWLAHIERSSSGEVVASTSVTVKVDYVNKLVAVPN